MAKKQKKEETETCSNCSGLGEIPGKRGNHPSVMLTPTRRCSVCQGEGVIPKEQK